MSYLYDVAVGIVNDAAEANRREGVEQALFQVLSNLDFLVAQAKLGELSWSDLQEIKDNIKILEAKTR